MRTIYEAITHALQSQFVSGGLVLMLSGSLIALCRKTPARIWYWLLRRLTIVVDISNDDPLFAWLTLWLAAQPYSQRARALTATSEKDGYGRGGAHRPVSPAESDDDVLPQVLFTPAPGNHLLLYRRRLLWLTRDRKEAAPSTDNDSILSMFKREVFTLRLIGRDQATARRLLEDAREVAMSRRQKKTEVFMASYDYWQRVDEKDPRPLSTVFLPEGVADTVVGDVKKFLASQQWYVERGIPWRRGWLFHGLPGTGKTSLICALAGFFRMNLYILSVSSSRITDDTLAHMLAQVPMRSIVLLEDVDAAFEQRKKSEDITNKLTFSGLLNALDGAASRDGSLVFMTTNHVDRLDKALVRPGRADFHLEFGSATVYQAESIFRAFFPEASPLISSLFARNCIFDKKTMAEIQQLLLENRDSVDDAWRASISKGLTEREMVVHSAASRRVE